MQRTAAFGLVLTLAASTALAAPEGEKLFREKCAMCHKVKGAGGILGPDLSRIGATAGEKALREQLVNPKKKNPVSTMPSFKGLPGKELDALVAYLKGLR